MQYRHTDTVYFIAAECRERFKEAIMKTKNVENGLALVGALLILVAVAFAATSALNNQIDLDFPLQGHTSTVFASS